ncbi:MAG: TolC family protein [Muribaculaceae bacterium]|nr:TolC family protein [Muribaculaceae bacterium]
MLPTIGLSAGYTYYGNLKMKGMTDMGNGNYQPFTQSFRDGMGMFMLSVNIPIFSWGERSNKVKKARLDVENATLDLQKNSRLMDLEVEQATRNLSDAYSLIETAQVGLRQADENLRIMNDRFALSLSPLTDLLDAQSQWQQAESNLIEAQAQYKISETEYLRALGRLE